MILTVEERIRMLSSEVEQCLNLEPDFNISSAVIDEKIHTWVDHENYWIELDPYGIFEYGASRGVTAKGESLADAIANEEKRYRLMEESRITREEFVAELHSCGISPCDALVWDMGDAKGSWIHAQPGINVQYLNLDWGYQIKEPVWMYKSCVGATLAAAIKRFKSRYQ